MHVAKQACGDPWGFTFLELHSGRSERRKSRDQDAGPLICRY